MLSQQAGIVYVASNTVCSACVHTSPDPNTSWLCCHESLMREEVCLNGVWVDLSSNVMLSAAQTREQQPFFIAGIFPCPHLGKVLTQLLAMQLSEPPACSEHGAGVSAHPDSSKLLSHIDLTSRFGIFLKSLPS